MKKLFILILATVVFNTIMTAQVPGNTPLSSAGTYISKETTGQTTAYYFGVYGIGKETVNGTVKVYRTYFEFDLSAIPTNATIQTVTVYLSNGKIGYTQKLTQISSLNPSDLSSSWQAIGNGSTIHSGLAYSPSSFVSTPMKNAIQSNLANRKLTVGALSESESTEGSNTSVSLSMYVEYTRPLAQINFSAHNDMEGYVGGHIGVGINASATDRTSPYSATATEGQTANIQAYDSGNSWSGYNFLFNDSEAPLNKSELKKQGGGTPQNFGNSSSGSYAFLQNDNGSEFIAVLRKVCNLTFTVPSGSIHVNNSTYNSSVTVPTVKTNTVQPTADNYYDQGLYYRFTGWFLSSANPSVSTITASINQTIPASYTREPSLLDMNFTLVSGIGSNPILTWNEHQHPDVTKYRIYRTIKNVETDVLIAELNRGTTTYTDYSRIITNNDATNNLTFYRLRVVLTPENLESEEWGQTCYTTVDMKLAGNDNNITMVKTEVPEDFSISSYPNPFNPTTTINYQLPENSYVTIKVYDILGKEIATLVNESKSAGFHNVNFDASRLTSGIYIYIINAGNYTQSKKMLLTK